MEIRIIRATKKNAPILASIDNEVFGGTFKEQDFFNYLNNPIPIYCFNIAIIDKKPVGYIGYMIIADEAEIINIGILSEHRGIGIGNMLMNRMIDTVKKRDVTSIYLEVRKSNSVAIKLYESFGFVTVGTSKNHYKEPTEDALRMNLCL